MARIIVHHECWKQNLAPTTEEQIENHQQRNDINKVKEKTESAYYQVTQIEINKRPRVQKLQCKFKIKETVKTANTTIGKALKDKDLILTEINHLSMQQQWLLQKK